MTQVLNWKNTYAVMIVPSLVYAFHVIMIRTFFQKLRRRCLNPPR